MSKIGTIITPLSLSLFHQTLISLILGSGRGGLAKYLKDGKSCRVICLDASDNAAKISVESTDLLPIKRVDIEIYNVASPTNKATLENLPLQNRPRATHPCSIYKKNRKNGGTVAELVPEE